MDFKELKLKIKEEQKQLAKDIRKGKEGRKPNNRNDSNRALYNALWSNRIKFRHQHVAYCEYFNKTPYERIETNPQPIYTFSRSKIDALKAEWEKSIFSLSKEEWGDLDG